MPADAPCPCCGHDQKAVQMVHDMDEENYQALLSERDALRDELRAAQDQKMEQVKMGRRLLRMVADARQERDAAKRRALQAESALKQCVGDIKCLLISGGMKDPGDDETRGLQKAAKHFASLLATPGFSDTGWVNS